MLVRAGGADADAQRPPADADALAGLAIPAALQASVERHRANLARLIVSLQRAGFCESQIDASVNAVIASYKAELLIAIKSLLQDNDV
jgi:hypothetical protein